MTKKIYNVYPKSVVLPKDPWTDILTEDWKLICTIVSLKRKDAMDDEEKKITKECILWDEDGYPDICVDAYADYAGIEKGLRLLEQETGKTYKLQKESHLKKNKESLREKLKNTYEKQKRTLLENAYSDNFGCTLTKKEYEKSLRNLQRKYERAKTTKTKELLKKGLSYTKKDLDEFKPQWFAYEEVLSLLKTIDEYLELEKRIEDLWEKRRKGTFVDWNEVKDKLGKDD